MTNTTKERFPGVDLSKIIAIFFVMIHHVSDCGLDVQPGNLTLSYIHQLLHSISYSCIDLFALATGFLCVNSSCRYSRIVSLWVATLFWGVSTLIFLHFCFGLRQLLSILIGFRIPGDRFALISYLSPFTLGVAIMIFIGCINMTIGNRVSRILKTVAATTFGVYLIHVQPFVWRNVWHANLHNIKVDSSIELVALVMVISCLTFICFSILEYCRLRMFASIGIDNLIRKIDNYIQR